MTWKISFSSSTNFYVLFGFSCQNNRPCCISSLSIPWALRGTNWWVLVVLCLVKQSFLVLTLFNQEPENSQTRRQKWMDWAGCSHQGPFSLPGSGTKAAHLGCTKQCWLMSSRMPPVYWVMRKTQAQGCSRWVCSWAGLCWVRCVTRWQTHDGQGL